jgi:hypothetical protein
MQLRLSSRHPKGANGAVKSLVRGLRFAHWAMMLIDAFNRTECQVQHTNPVPLGPAGCPGYV